MLAAYSRRRIRADVSGTPVATRRLDGRANADRAAIRMEGARARARVGGWVGGLVGGWVAGWVGYGRVFTCSSSLEVTCIAKPLKVGWSTYSYRSLLSCAHTHELLRHTPARHAQHVTHARTGVGAGAHAAARRSTLVGAFALPPIAPRRPFRPAPPERFAERTHSPSARRNARIPSKCASTLALLACAAHRHADR